jgi:Uma2 family endonuclease
MNIIAEKPLLTPEDLEAMPDGDRFELIDGHLVEPSMSMLSSYVGTKLVTRVDGHCQAGNLGWVWGADLQFQCFPHVPNRVRKPDLSFIRRDRLAAAQMKEGMCRVVPDLVAEVVSPNDLFDEIEERSQDWLRAGVRLLWVVSLKTPGVYVHRADGTITRARREDQVSGEDVLPDFLFRLNDLLPPTE